MKKLILTCFIIAAASSLGYSQGLRLEPIVKSKPGDASGVSILCGDASITPGILAAYDSTICYNDTATVTDFGAVGPDVGANHGLGIIISLGPISGSNDPLGQPGVLGGTTVISPIPPGVGLQIPNNGSQLPPGNYYFTAVVFGNATGSGSYITDLTLDPSCTYSGTSLLITFYAQGNPNCTVGLNDPKDLNYSIQAFQQGSNSLSLEIDSRDSFDGVIQILDVSGRVVMNEKAFINQGPNTIHFDITGLSAGSYMVRIGNSSRAGTTKFIRY